jgi:hypothetical protein
MKSNIGDESKLKGNKGNEEQKQSTLRKMTKTMKWNIEHEKKLTTRIYQLKMNKENEKTQIKETKDNKKRQ